MDKKKSTKKLDTILEAKPKKEKKDKKDRPESESISKRKIKRAFNTVSKSFKPNRTSTGVMVDKTSANNQANQTHQEMLWPSPGTRIAIDEKPFNIAITTKSRKSNMTRIDSFFSSKEDSNENIYGTITMPKFKKSVQFLNKYERHLAEYIETNESSILHSLTNYELSLEKQPNLAIKVSKSMYATQEESKFANSSPLVMEKAVEVYTSDWMELKINKLSNISENQDLPIDIKLVPEMQKLDLFDMQNFDIAKKLIDQQTKYLFAMEEAPAETAPKIRDRIPKLRKTHFENVAFDLNVFNVSLKTFDLNATSCEPILITVSLYDSKHKRKLCEDFRITCDAKGNIEKQNSVVFVLKKGHEDVAVVVRGFKIFRNVDKDISNPYLGVKWENEKEQEKYDGNTVKILNSRPLLSSFFWSAVFVGKESNGIFEFPLFNSPFPSNIESLSKLLKEISKNETQNWIKLSGKMEMEISTQIPIDEDENKTEWEYKIAESFHLATKMNQTLKNTLNIHPISIKGLRANTKSTLLTVSVLESQEKSEPVQLTGKCSSISNSNSFKEFSSSVTNDEGFLDEISIDIPLLITSKYLLQFTFYSISKSGVKIAEKALTVPLITKKGVFIEDTKYVLQDKSNVKDSIETARKSKKKKEEEEIFEFEYQTKFVSSILMNDEHLRALFHAIETLKANVSEENQTLQTNWFAHALNSMNKMPDYAAASNFPVIFNSLLNLCVQSKDKSGSCFVLVVEYLKRISSSFDSSISQDRALKSYMTKVFEPPENCHEIIVNDWVKLFTKNHKCIYGFSMQWILFDAIFKSLCASKGDEIGKDRAFPSLFRHKFSELTIHILRNSDRTSAYDLGLLFRDLFLLMDRGFLLKTIHNACISIVTEDSAIQDSIKQVCSFFDVLTDFPDYLVLNMPNIEDPYPMIQSFQQETPYWTHFPFSGAFLHNLNFIIAGDKDCTEAIAILYKLLMKHDSSNLSVSQLKQVTVMYFPFIMKISSVATRIINNQKSIEWVLCFIYILKNVERDLLVNWWKSESISCISSFLLLMSHCVKQISESNCNDLFKEECYLVLLDLCITFANTFNQALSKEGSPFIGTFFSVVTKLIINTPTEFFRKSAFITFSVFIKQFPDHILNNKNTFCEDFAFLLLKFCVSDSQKVRDDAVEILFLLININQKLKENFSLMKMACSLSISKLLSNEKEFKGVENLKLSLECLTELSNQEQFSFLYSEVKELQSRLLSVCQNLKKLHQNQNNPEVKVEICRKICLGYSKSADLRLTWMNLIAQINVDRNMLEEAAQTFIVISSFVLQFLQHSNKFQNFKLTVQDLEKVSPNISIEEFQITKHDVENLKSSVWNLEGLCENISKAADLFFKAKIFASSIEMYNQLILLYSSSKQYLKLNESYLKASQVTSSFMKEENCSTSKFFRVSFYGEIFKKENTKSYIYKEKFQIRLVEFKNKILQQFEHLGKLELISNMATDFEKFKESKEIGYLQIANVNVASETTLNKFSLDVAHSEQKKQQQNVANQQRKIIFFTTSSPFPHINNRIEISSTHEIILSPLENAIQLMEQRVKAIEVALVAPQATVLSGILYGNLMTTVAEGPEAICEAFLPKQTESPRKISPRKPKDMIFPPIEFDIPSSGSNSPVVLIPELDLEENERTGISFLAEDDENLKLIEKLKISMKKFIKLSERALEQHESLMESSMIPWQEACKERFVKLKEFISKFV